MIYVLLYLQVDMKRVKPTSVNLSLLRLFICASDILATHRIFANHMRCLAVL